MRDFKIEYIVMKGFFFFKLTLNTLKPVRRKNWISKIDDMLFCNRYLKKF